MSSSDSSSSEEEDPAEAFVGFGTYRMRTYRWVVEQPNLALFRRWVLSVQHPHGAAFIRFQTWLKEHKRMCELKRKHDEAQREQEQETSRTLKKQRLHKRRIAEVKRIKLHVQKMKERYKQKYSR